MSRDNITERRAHIKRLLDTGADIDVRALAREWDSSPVAITVDVSMVQGHGDPYRSHCVTKQNQRARRLGVQGQLTISGWQAILKAHDGACVECCSTKDIVIDHIVPLSRGGSNTLDNVQPLCRSCNSRNGNR